MVDDDGVGLLCDCCMLQDTKAVAARRDTKAVAAGGDDRLAAAREDLEMAMDRIQAANASLAEARDFEAEVGRGCYDWESSGGRAGMHAIGKRSSSGAAGGTWVLEAEETLTVSLSNSSSWSRFAQALHCTCAHVTGARKQF